jgi:hypothetical protein
VAYLHGGAPPTKGVVTLYNMPVGWGLTPAPFHHHSTFIKPYINLKWLSYTCNTFGAMVICPFLKAIAQPIGQGVKTHELQIICKQPANQCSWVPHGNPCLGHMATLYSLISDAKCQITIGPCHYWSLSPHYPVPMLPHVNLLMYSNMMST